jgi:lipopolysaccharide export system protein LptA
MLTAAFGPGTKYLENIHVQKQAFLHAANNSSAIGNELHADDIRMGFRQAGERAALEKLHAEGSARWSSEPSQQPASKSREPGRILSASSLDMLYSSEGDSFESGSASGKVMISESRSPIKDQSKARRLLADRVQFYFFPGKNRLREMNASGHVQVIQENRAVNKASSTVDSFRTSSDNMKVVFLPEQNDSSIQSLAQWGSFKYQDASTSATAGRCDYDAQKETLVLKDSPQISNETNSTTGEWMEYEQKTGVLSVRGRVRSLLSSGKNEASFFTASSSSSPAIVTANEMQYWTADRRAQYTGSVQLLSENGQLQAGILNITDGGERVTAQNGIRHYMIPGRSASETQARTDKAEDAPKPESKAVEIRCSSLKYLKARNTITYEGNVTAHSGDIDLSSESLEAMIADEGGAVEHAIAYGKVTIRQGGRECKGDKADYFLDRRAFILTGNPAEILDPVKGRSFASQLTYFIADDRILLENR